MNDEQMRWSWVLKLRAEAHNLRIEAGRHTGLDQKDRTCQICDIKSVIVSSDIEDVAHFLCSIRAFLPLPIHLHALLPSRRLLHLAILGLGPPIQWACAYTYLCCKPEARFTASVHAGMACLGGFACHWMVTDQICSLPGPCITYLVFTCQAVIRIEHGHVPTMRSIFVLHLSMRVVSLFCNHCWHLALASASL
jgi:hypothetical protein